MLNNNVIASIIIAIIILCCYYNYILKNRCYILSCQKKKLENCKFFHDGKCIKYKKKYI